MYARLLLSLFFLLFAGRAYSLCGVASVGDDPNTVFHISYYSGDSGPVHVEYFYKDCSDCGPYTLGQYWNWNSGGDFCPSPGGYFSRVNGSFSPLSCGASGCADICPAGTNWTGNSYSCVVTPDCSSSTTSGSCIKDGVVKTVGMLPGNWDSKYSQLVPTCDSASSYFLGSCNKVPIAALTAVFHEWTQTVAGVWYAKPIDIGRKLEVDALNTLLKGVPTVSSELATLPELSTAARVVAIDASLTGAVTVIGAGVIAWKLSELGTVLLDKNETSTVLGPCAGGFSGPDCNTQTSTATQWPSDGKPTYYVDQATNTINYHPRDPDIPVPAIDLTKNPAGVWQYSYDSANNPTDYLLIPDVGGGGGGTSVSGPALLSRTSYSDGTSSVTIRTSGRGDMTVWRPAPLPVGPVAIFDPVIDSTGRVSPITDTHYEPLPAPPSTNPATSPSPFIVPAPAPIPAPTTSPSPAPTGSPTTSPSPFVIPSPAPSSSPLPSPSNRYTESSSCTCPLTLPPLQAPTLAETTSQTIAVIGHAIGLGITIPTISGSCPLLSFNTGSAWFGTLSTDVHCQILESNRTLIRSIELILWILTAVFIVLSA